MKHSITLGIEFFFKGKKYTPTMILNLDAYILNNEGIDALYAVLAKNNNIDLYSYEYEMMQAEALVFSEATGLAVEHLESGKFNFHDFSQALQKENITETLAAIANKHLSVDELAADPKLEAALFEAYKLGQKSE